jgi:hypothetical protein
VFIVLRAVSASIWLRSYRQRRRLSARRYG